MPPIKAMGASIVRLIGPKLHRRVATPGGLIDYCVEQHATDTLPPALWDDEEQVQEQRTGCNRSLTLVGSERLGRRHR